MFELSNKFFVYLLVFGHHSWKIIGHELPTSCVPYRKFLVKFQGIFFNLKNRRFR